jgi:hypothetical protein
MDKRINLLMKDTLKLSLLMSLLSLSACGGGDPAASHVPTLKERIEGTWAGSLTQQPTSCTGSAQGGPLSAKDVVHKLSLNDRAVNLVDETGQVSIGKLSSDVDFDVAWSLVSANSIDDNTISYRNIQAQSAEVSVKRVAGVTGATCTFLWSGKLTKK